MSQLEVDKILPQSSTTLELGQANSTISVIGTLDGNQLSNISANNITSGTLADARLSSNVTLNNASTISTGTLDNDNNSLYAEVRKLSPVDCIFYLEASIVYTFHNIFQ